MGRTMSDAARTQPAQAPTSPPHHAHSSRRIESVDLLRGVAMVVMALDHVRNHLHRGAMAFDPTDLGRTTQALFLTRWLTHFCAPVFVFLAGTGAYLWGARGRTKDDLARYLLTRGLWLVVLELTVVNWEWQMGVNYAFVNAQVIWALGWSMVALAALVRLPLPAIGACGWWMILGHNLFDGVKSESLGPFGPLWTVLHVRAPIVWAPGHTLFIMYPLVPWIGVMAAGYAFGSWMANEHPKRSRRIIAVGLALMAVFAELRTYNFYGDPHAWARQHDGLFTALSFLNCEKYPPSLLFLLMTLGPALVLLGLTDRGLPALARPLVVFGRVPLFYYVVHLALIDVVTVALAIVRYGSRVRQVMANGPPPDYGYSLPVVYAVWIGVVVALYPVCRWYAGVKASRRSPLLGYL
jgi:uncharacterized membrane protein